MRELAGKIREKKDWISEEEVAEITDKIAEAEKWLEDKMNEQSQLSPRDDPAFTARQLEQKIEQIEKIHRNVSNKKKPRPKPKVDKLNLENGENVNFDSENIKFENVNFGEGVNPEDFIKFSNTGDKDT